MKGRSEEDMKIWDPLHECMPREEVEQLQLERLQATLNRVHKNVAYYRKKFNDLGVIPEDIQSLSDLAKLPLTAKEDLTSHYPYGMFAVPLRDIVRIHSASVPSAKPLVVGYTKNDIRTWSNLVARIMTAAGVTHDDVVQIAFRYGLITGAFGIHYGAETIGALVIPAGTGNTERQIMIMQDYRTTALVSTPSYAMILADRMDRMGVNPKGLSVRSGLFSGEPWSYAMRQEIEERLNLVATDNYVLSEIMGPGIAGECPCKCGMHLFEDAFLPEIIDPKSGEILPPGKEGELVLTTLSKEAFPLIRYRTRDITSLDYAICDCGRTSVRMMKTMGRTDDMLIVKGVNIFPSQIEEILLNIEPGGAPYQVVIDRQNALDILEIRIEVTARIFSLEMQRQGAFLEMVKKRVESVIGIDINVKLVEPKSLPKMQGNVIKVVDQRKL
jgi:phenylacetate-CoA ligase